MGIRLRFPDARTAELLGTAFAPLLVKQPGPEPVMIDVIDAAGGAAAEVPEEWVGEGERLIMRFEDAELAVVVQEAEIVVSYNRAARRAIVQVPDVEAIPAGERDTRLRYAFQLALGAHDRSMIHAAVVGDDGRGALLPGRSGSGKSTLSVACVLAGMEFCADDYVILGPEGLRAHALLTTAKLSHWSVTALGLDGSGPRLYDNRGFMTPKATVDLRGVAPASIRPSLEVACVVVPGIAGVESPSADQISRAAALRALAPSTMYQQPTRQEGLLRAMARVLAAVPCFELRLAPDPAANAAAVRELLAASAPSS